MGKLSIACMKGGQKFVDGLRYVLAVFRLWRPSQGSRRVPKGSQCTTQCGMRRQDKIFYCGIISLWEIWTLLAWEIDQEIYDDLRYALAVFRFWGPPKTPCGSPMVSNGQSSLLLEVEIRYWTMCLFYYGKTGCFLHKTCKKKNQMIWWIF